MSKKCSNEILPYIPCGAGSCAAKEREDEIDMSKEWGRGGDRFWCRDRGRELMFEYVRVGDEACLKALARAWACFLLRAIFFIRLRGGK